MTSGTSLHYISSEYNIGDVHPFYNEKDKTWYMFYLKPGDYGARLLVSEDLITWTPKEIGFENNVAPAKYYVLGVVQDGDLFRSFYGRGSYHGSTMSSDLLVWKNSPGAYKVPNDITLFPAGARDPYVFYDPDADVYRCVSTAYRSNKEWSKGSGMDVSIALTSTSANSLDTWVNDQKELIHLPDGYQGEPECSQMAKIGDRWYLFTSLARRTNNWVGRPTYWIGDAGATILANDWQSKPENSLDGDDLCAAQIASDGKRNLLWGWIEKKWEGGDWGGHINFPHEVYAQPDGTLSTRLESSVGKAIRGKELSSISAAMISTGQRSNFKGTYSRVDLQATIKASDANIYLHFGDIKVVLNQMDNRIAVVKDETMPLHYYAAYDVPEGTLDGTLEVRVVVEDDIFEVFVNDRFSLCARVSEAMKNDMVGISVESGAAELTSARIYHLKFLEELE
jgi:sucrose-6-phosphate hydrolase SacC (GH32 family)